MMPIKGLISEAPTLREGLPLVARIYKGDEKPESGNRPGKDLDYFRVEFEEQFAEYAEVFTMLYGTEPDVFENVHVVGENADEAFDYWMEEWNTSQTLIHKCDGEYQKRWWDERTSMYITAQTPCVNETDKLGIVTKQVCNCTKVGRLSIILKDFTAMTGVFGYFLITTGSINDIVTVFTTLRMAERLAARAGHSLSAVPFHFGRVSRDISVPGQKKNKSTGEYERTGKRMKVSKSLFFLHADPEYNKQVLLPALVNAPALPEPKPDTILTLPDPQIMKPAITGDQAKKVLGNGGRTRKMETRGQVMISYVDVKKDQNGKLFMETKVDDYAYFTWTRDPFRAAGIECDHWTQENKRHVFPESSASWEENNANLRIITDIQPPVADTASEDTPAESEDVA